MFCKSKGIPRSTWLGILKHEDKLLNDNNNQTSKKRKRDGKYAELEEARKNFEKNFARFARNVLSFHGNLHLKSTMMHFVTLILLYIAL